MIGRLLLLEMTLAVIRGWIKTMWETTIISYDTWGLTRANAAGIRYKTDVRATTMQVNRGVAYSRMAAYR